VEYHQFGAVVRDSFAIKQVKAQTEIKALHTDQPWLVRWIHSVHSSPEMARREPQAGKPKEPGTKLRTLNIGSNCTPKEGDFGVWKAA
jgi:hypothetical protein